MRLPGVGMRTVKTAVAVMLSYLVFVPFGLLYREELGGVLGQIGPMYACIACVVCMQSSLGQTMQQGISRFIGVAVGGILGVVALSLGCGGDLVLSAHQAAHRLRHGLHRTLRDPYQRHGGGGAVLLRRRPDH